MRAVVQRVRRGEVEVGESVVGQIGQGYVVLLGVGATDTEEDGRYLANKIAHLRVFEDEDGKLNRSVRDVQGEILVVSQFTLFGDCRKGRRPSFSDAAPPKEAKQLYELFVKELKALGIRVATGVFQTHMDVSLTNDGPVTLIISSKGEF